MSGITVKQTLLALLFLAALSAPASAQDDTLAITLKGLPPASTAPLPGWDSTQPAFQPPGHPSPPPALRPPPSSAPQRDVVGRLGVCMLHGAPIYRGQTEGGRLLARVAQGTYLAIKSEYGSWYAVLMIDNSLGWIQKSTVRLLEFNVVRSGPEAPGAGIPPTGRLSAEVLREAFRYLGVPYVWGGNTAGGLDCSGLVKNCFAHCGVPLPRRASEQARVGQPVPLSLAALEPGDRLYFAVSRRSIDHTALYLGNGYFIHASLSRGRVAIDRLSTPLYGRHLVAARRL